MKKILSLLAAALILIAAAPAGAAWRVVAEKTVSGFGHPESVAHDPIKKCLYVSRFGPELKPTQKDGQGFISRLDLEGKVLEERFLPGPDKKMDKPKGIWVDGGKLWVTDIDGVWCFDLQTKRGQKAVIVGAQFANDVIALGPRLYVSDTALGVVYFIHPNDLLRAAPKEVRVMTKQPGQAPNGLYITRQKQFLMASSPADGSGRIFKLTKKAGRISWEPLTPPLGRLDGLGELEDGTLIYTDWAQKGLFVLEGDEKPRLLAGGFGGPADFALMPHGRGHVVVVPDLVKGDIRFITLEP